ncbi:MAG: transcriptional repressor LexA [Spirochaetaceae bacterium]|nr:MAG: transcriptional repressor LexA [Spirochaetaceae bacterium]
MKELTKRQYEVFRFIESYIQKNSFPPAIRDVSDAFGISVKGAYDHIDSLQKKGWIKRSANRSRSMELLTHSEPEEPQPELVAVPLLGDVAAGLPLLAEENHEGRLDLPAAMLGKGNFFGLRVKGDSMQGDGIYNGDIAIIRQQRTAQNGDVVVAMLGDSATLKRYYLEKNRIRLQAANPAYPPIYTQEIRILGTLAHLIRNYN